MSISIEEMFPEFVGAKFTFGLEAQGHIPTIERMLSDNATWDEIGKAIGWSAEAVERHWGYHLEKRPGPSAPSP